MDKPKVTSKDFFLWAGAMIALYWSIIAFLTLIFSYVDFAFPDALDYYVDPYSGGMRFAMASIIVLFPLFLVFMRLIRKDITKHPQKSDLWVRRWLIVLTIFVATFTVAGDLITLINYFLGGEITTRFILKVAVVLLVAAGVLMHFLADLWGYWEKNPHYAQMIGYATGVLLLLSIVAGFFIMGTPGEIRLYRFDDQKVGDLQNIQSQVVYFWQQKEKLPISLAELADPISGNLIPADPQSGAPYTYQAIDKLSFKLCATFNAETQPNSMYSRNYPMRYPTPASVGPEMKGVDLESQPWTHGAGEVCFTRTIDPERYPSLRKSL
jgi:Domain of unknown function (DUF5671)